LLKCKFFITKIKFLRLIISCNSICIDLEKILFISFINFYYYFIYNFLKIIELLTCLT
ncbi:hypothetical protein K458DRAFT_319008, partial [Lentithecium fluviatile CBS 122367]